MRAWARCTNRPQLNSKCLVVKKGFPLANAASRFAAVPVSELQDKLVSQMKQMETDVEGLGKRLHYLETTAKNSQEHIEKMLQGGVRA